MTVGPHVFGDNRLGLMIMNPAYLGARIPKIKALGFTDLFLPESTQKSDIAIVQPSGLLSQLWFAPDGRSAGAFVDAVHQKLTALGNRAVELNIESTNDNTLEPYMRETITLLRKKRPNLRIRLNIALNKAIFLPVDLILNDPQLFVSEQNYMGNMEGMASTDDVRRNMIDYGVSIEKGSICFAGACQSPESSFSERVPMLPAVTMQGMRKGIVFQDDLLTEVGII